MKDNVVVCSTSGCWVACREYPEHIDSGNGSRPTSDHCVISSTKLADLALASGSLHKGRVSGYVLCGEEADPKF